ncbi:MAG: UDP-2,3-diacylglucosamine diphosphatase [Bacteroidales bacterium]|nr:UDP-2,3-diacylglucosamine diphosphatase [Bacteroidales bacterium]
MQLVPAQYYFIADVHLGAKLPGEESVKSAFLDFLSSIPQQAKAIYLLGDIFDFWAEVQGKYPEDYTVFLQEMKRLTDSGVRIVFLKGNHDYWTFGYLENEIGLDVIDTQPHIETIGGKKFAMAHGDGLGNRGIGYPIIKFFFRNKLNIKLLNLCPPKFIYNFGRDWSKYRKQRHHTKDSNRYKGLSERLAAFSEEFIKNSPVDIFVYGHIHQVVDTRLGCGARMMVLGDWYNNPTYISYSEGEEPVLNRIRTT